jgi:protein phosphatase
MKLTIPELSLVVLIGVSGSGKSSFARKHFKPTEILSSDQCRALVSDDENCQAATSDAFEILHFIARKRLAAGRLTVVDATNVQGEARKPLVEIAREYHCLPVAIVLDVPERTAHERNKARPDRNFGPHVIRQQASQLRRSIRGLQREGFRHIQVLKTTEEVDDIKFMRKVWGKEVQVTHGLGETLAQFEAQEAKQPGSMRAAAEFIDGLVSHYVLDDGKLVVAHAGMKEAMQGRGSAAVREFALFGETTGETDEFGLPVRYPWAAEYRGSAMVVYGHTPVPKPEWLNQTVNIDTGCVFGGRLTALRYPEREWVSVPSKATYAEPRRPFLPPEEQAPSFNLQQRQDELLDLADVRGKRIVDTRLHGKVTIREENAMAALEVMSRFAVHPKWLIYLPPTMSPCATSQRPALLEHPSEAFAYFRHEGIPRVICEEKHMGSRAVVIVCRDEEVAQRRFGVAGEGFGISYTRTGRRFFGDPEMESGLLARVRDAITRAGLWEELATDWVCLDCELMPWSAKAQALLKEQYAPVGSAAEATLGDAVQLLDQAASRGLEVGDLRLRTEERQSMVSKYVAAYRRYCWKVDSVDDLKLAPFHLLASEGKVHGDMTHEWHMATLARLSGGVLVATPHRIVEVTNPESEAMAVEWWEEMTSRGGEGMVVKPYDYVVRGRRGLIQPAVKCRGPEYLRIIYGPEYTAPMNLERLRTRGLTAKRSLALREFALGVEALERFARGEPLRRVHECVFGVLALESEPVDPRL